MATPASVSPEKKEEDEKTKEDKRTEKKRREKGQKKKKKRTRGGSAAFIAGVSHKARVGLGGTKMKFAIKNHSFCAIARAME